MIKLTPTEIKYMNSQPDHCILFTFSNSTYLAQLTDDGKSIEFYRRAPKTGNFNLVKNETKEVTIAENFKIFIKTAIKEEKTKQSTKEKSSKKGTKQIHSYDEDNIASDDDGDGDGYIDEDQISSGLQRLFDSEWLLPIRLIFLFIRILLIIGCFIAYIFLVSIKYTLLPIVNLLHQFAYLIASLYIIGLFVAGNKNPQLISEWYYSVLWFIGVVVLLLPTIARFLPDLIKTLSTFMKNELFIHNN